MGLFVAGMNHRTAPVGVREQLALEEDKLREILREVLASGGMSEAVIVSTCNRVELYGVAEVPGEARATVFRHLGIPLDATWTNPQGRPIHIVTEGGRAIGELG